jgi:hypothetical protein
MWKPRKMRNVGLTIKGNVTSETGQNWDWKYR